MKPEERETSTERIIRLSLWAALAMLYMTLVVVTFMKLALAPQPDGAQSIDAAWLGFWGNVVGGVLGLSGGLIAAYAAVRAVERQLSYAAKRRDEEEESFAGEMYLYLVQQTLDKIDHARALLKAAERGEHVKSIELTDRIVLGWRIEHNHYARHLVEKLPTAGLRLEMVIGIQRKWIETKAQALEANKRPSSEKVNASVPPRLNAAACCLVSATYLVWLTNLLEALSGPLKVDGKNQETMERGLRSLAASLFAHAEASGATKDPVADYKPD